MIRITQRLEDQIENVEEDIKALNFSYLELYEKINKFRKHLFILNVITFGTFSIYYNSLLDTRTRIQESYSALQKNKERLVKLRDKETKRVEVINKKREIYSSKDYGFNKESIAQCASKPVTSYDSNKEPNIHQTPPPIINYNHSDYTATSKYDSHHDTSACSQYDSSSSSSVGGCE